MAAHPDVAGELRRAFEIERLLPRSAGLRDGDRLGPWRIRERLGQGGMGTVFRAEDAALGREVALKVVADDPLRPSRALARFEREARAIARLRHPAIVTVHATGQDGPWRWIAMDLVRGPTLQARLAAARAEGRPLPVADAARLGLAVASALACAHAEGVIHRDVKPGNILLDERGHAVLGDFGLALVTGEPGLTASEDRLGTAGFLAPELIRGRAADAGARSDVFALGATLYEALTLARPFPGATTHEIQAAVLAGPPRPPRRLRADLPRDLDVIVMTALDPDPGRRYPTAAALAADLEAFLGFRPVAARAPSPARRALLAVRRRPIAALGAAAALAVAAALAAPMILEAARARDELARERAAFERASAGGDRRVAAAHAARILDLAPDDGEARAHLESLRAGDALDEALLHAALFIEGPLSPSWDPGRAREALARAGALVADDGTLALVLALVEFVERDREAASRLVEAALACRPTRGLARLRSLIAIDAAGGREWSADDEKAAAGIPVASPGERLQDGLMLSFLGREAEAFARFQELVQADTRHFWGHAWLFTLHLAREDGHAAAALATHLADLRPEWWVPAWWRLRAWNQVRRLDLAKAELARLRALDAPAAVAEYAGLILRRREEPAAAIAPAAREALERHPEDLPLRLFAAEAALEAGDAASAAGILEAARERHPHHLGVLMGLASARLRAGRHDEARPLLESILERRPSQAGVRVLLASCFTAAKDAAGALRELDLALRINPSFRPALIARGRARAASGDLPGALLDLRRALEREPGNATARGLQAAVEALLAEPGSARAWALAVEARRHLPEDRTSLLARADEVRRSAEARGLRDEEAAEPLFLALRGLRRLETGRPDEAAAAFDAAATAFAQARPGDAAEARATHLALGRLAAALGRPAEARTHLESVLAGDPEHAEARAALERLQEKH